MFTEYFFKQQYAAGFLVEFIICALIIVFAGIKLSRYGYAIGKATGLSGAWIGLIFLAGITSVPELTTCIGSVILISDATRASDLALGNIFGSCIFNLMIIVILDFIEGKGPLLIRVKSGHILSASYGILLMAVATMGIAVASILKLIPPNFGWIFSLVIAFVYLTNVRLTFRYERKDHLSQNKVVWTSEDGPRALLYLKFCVVGAIIILAGLWLVKLAASLAEFEFRLFGSSFRLGESFTGTIFLAIATSMPEIVVTISAFRLGAADMALGNIFGSNIFNIAIIPILDIFSRGIIFLSASSTNIIILVIAIILTVITIIGLTYRSEKSFLRLGWDSITMLIIYILGMYTLFRAGVKF